MSKVAIPVKDNLLSRSFNFCSFFLIYEVKERKIIGKKIEFFPYKFRSDISGWSDKSGITDVIVNTIDEASLSEITASKINIFVGVKISTPDLLIAEFLQGTLRSDTRHILETC